MCKIEVRNSHFSSTELLRHKRTRPRKKTNVRWTHFSLLSTRYPIVILFSRQFSVGFWKCQKTGLGKRGMRLGLRPRSISEKGRTKFRQTWNLGVLPPPPPPITLTDRRILWLQYLNTVYFNMYIQNRPSLNRRDSRENRTIIGSRVDREAPRITSSHIEFLPAPCPLAPKNFRCKTNVSALF